MTTASLCIVPVSLSAANQFVREHHRHHGPVVGHKFSVGAFDGHGLVGVAIVGRPVARHMDDDETLEITRLCTDGTRNAASKMLGAVTRAAMAMGYTRVITYTLKSESGTSLRASGYRVVAEVRGREWSCPSRPRRAGPEAQATDKLRWEVCA
jgi:hypothetical protein